MVTIHPEKSAVKRWLKRYVISDIELYDQKITILRLRWWPIAIWLGHNLIILVWYMLAAIGGRTVSFDPSGWWYAPFRFVWSLIN